jgi:Tfp pilus assembly protein PilF
MYSQRFTNSAGSGRCLHLLAQLMLCAAFLSGCGSTSTSRSPEGGENTQVEERDVPPHARTLYEQAVSIMASGDYLEAQFRFQEFLLQYPTYPGAHVNLAIIYASNGDDEGAENSITDALIIDPRHPAALNQLGMLLRRQGKFQDAEAAYTRAITADPEYALGYYNLGVLNELYLQQLDVALQNFERYQALGSNDKQVEKWIVDLKRRIAANQRTANVTE